MTARPALRIGASGILQLPADVTAEEVAAAAHSFEEARRRGDLIVLHDGAAYHPLPRRNHIRPSQANPLRWTHRGGNR